MITLPIMRLMAWLFTVTPFVMTLLFAAVFLNEGFVRAIALYRRAYPTAHRMASQPRRDA